jgi:tRNA dimethylallyltransferase
MDTSAQARTEPGATNLMRGSMRDAMLAAGGDRPRRHPPLRQATITWFRHQLPEFERVKPEAARDWLSAVIPGWFEGPDPESRVSGFARFTRAPE